MFPGFQAFLSVSYYRGKAANSLCMLVIMLSKLLAARTPVPGKKPSRPFQHGLTHLLFPLPQPVGIGRPSNWQVELKCSKTLRTSEEERQRKPLILNASLRYEIKAIILMFYLDSLGFSSPAISKRVYHFQLCHSFHLSQRFFSCTCFYKNCSCCLFILAQKVFLLSY